MTLFTPEMFMSIAVDMYNDMTDGRGIPTIQYYATELARMVAINHAVHTHTVTFIVEEWDKGADHVTEFHNAEEMVSYVKGKDTFVGARLAEPVPGVTFDDEEFGENFISIGDTLKECGVNPLSALLWGEPPKLPATDLGEGIEFDFDLGNEERFPVPGGAESEYDPFDVEDGL
jgi:hypothetical protein